MGVDWVPCQSYGQLASTTIPPGGSIAAAFVLCTTGLNAVGSRVGAPDTDPERVTSKRIIGQLETIWASDEGGSLNVDWRFTVGLLPEGVPPPIPYTTDLNLPQNANEQFMHERRYRQPAGTTSLDLAADPRWSMYDIRVSRTLRAAECTIVVGNFQSLSGGVGTLLIRPFLRSWVTTSD